jgi:NTP pyrophosphatase (non-canonical NTP hydrolase)
MSSESQRSINDWATESFGEPITGSYIYINSAADRACEEMHEFRQAVLSGLNQDIIEEAADVVITLYRLASIMGYDLHDQIDRKMAINRHRKWTAHGDGTGHHIKDLA